MSPPIPFALCHDGIITTNGLRVSPSTPSPTDKKVASVRKGRGRTLLETKPASRQSSGNTSRGAVEAIKLDREDKHKEGLGEKRPRKQRSRAGKRKDNASAGAAAETKCASKREDREGRTRVLCAVRANKSRGGEPGGGRANKQRQRMEGRKTKANGGKRHPGEKDRKRQTERRARPSCERTSHNGHMSQQKAEREDPQESAGSGKEGAADKARTTRKSGGRRRPDPVRHLTDRKSVV